MPQDNKEPTRYDEKNTVWWQKGHEPAGELQKDGQGRDYILYMDPFVGKKAKVYITNGKVPSKREIEQLLSARQSANPTGWSDKPTIPEGQRDTDASIKAAEFASVPRSVPEVLDDTYDEAAKRLGNFGTSMVQHARERNQTDLDNRRQVEQARNVGVPGPRLADSGKGFLQFLGDELNRPVSQVPAIPHAGLTYPGVQTLAELLGRTVGPVARSLPNALKGGTARSLTPKANAGNVLADSWLALINDDGAARMAKAVPGLGDTSEGAAYNSLIDFMTDPTLIFGVGAAGKAVKAAELAKAAEGAEGSAVLSRLVKPGTVAEGTAATAEGAQTLTPYQQAVKEAEDLGFEVPEHIKAKAAVPVPPGVYRNPAPEPGAGGSAAPASPNLRDITKKIDAPGGNPNPVMPAKGLPETVPPDPTVTPPVVRGVRQGAQSAARPVLRGARKLGEGLTEAKNTIQALNASGDHSAIGRQGGFLEATRWRQAGRALVDSVKSMATEEGFEAVQQRILNHPRAKEYGQAGLYLDSSQGSALTAGEEGFRSNLSEKIPGLGKIIKGSNRAYAGYLNSLRSQVYVNSVDAAEKAAAKAGQTLSDVERKGIAEYINIATGRGQLTEETAQRLAHVMWAPRWQYSRAQLLNPATYRALPPAAQKLAVRDVAAQVGTAIGLMNLLKAGGHDVQTNPFKAHFGQVRIEGKKGGSTYVDLIGSGLGPWVRFGFAALRDSAGIVGNAYQDATGGQSKADRFREASRYSTEQSKKPAYTPLLTPTLKFAEGRANPLVTLFIDAGRGTDFSGKPTWGASPVPGVPNAVYSRTATFTAQELASAIREHGFTGGMALTGVSALGGGVNTYEAKETEKKPKPKPLSGDVPKGAINVRRI
jgi:hypothetical protein